MSAPKHTPGPWHTCSANDGACICGLVWSSDQHSVVATAHTERAGLATCHDERDAHDMAPGISHEERIANARVIAAAPDMLAMLRRTVETRTYDRMEIENLLARVDGFVLVPPKAPASPACKHCGAYPGAGHFDGCPNQRAGGF